MLQENHSFKIAFKMRSWGWWGSVWFRKMKTTTSDSICLILCVPTCTIWTRNEVMWKKFWLSLRKDVYACLLLCCRGQHQNPPESSFLSQAFLVKFLPFHSFSVIATQESTVRGSALMCLIHLHWNQLVLLITLIFFIKGTDNWKKFWTHKISVLLSQSII